MKSQVKKVISAMRFQGYKNHVHTSLFPCKNAALRFNPHCKKQSLCGRRCIFGDKAKMQMIPPPSVNIRKGADNALLYKAEIL